MIVDDLRFAVGDAQRFIDRANLIIAKTEGEEIGEQDARTLSRLALDANRAFQDLRKEIKIVKASGDLAVVQEG